MNLTNLKAVNAIKKQLTSGTLCAASLLLGFGAYSTTAHADVQSKYNASCATCHQAGVLGAPKTGDKAAWAPHLKKGMTTLVNNTKNGYKNMPARGLCDDCSDADYKALIELMAK